MNYTQQTDIQHILYAMNVFNPRVDTNKKIEEYTLEDFDNLYYLWGSYIADFYLVIESEYPKNIRGLKIKELKQKGYINITDQYDIEILESNYRDNSLILFFNFNNFYNFENWLSHYPDDDYSSGDYECWKKEVEDLAYSINKYRENNTICLTPTH